MLKILLIYCSFITSLTITNKISVKNIFTVKNNTSNLNLTSSKTSDISLPLNDSNLNDNYVTIGVSDSVNNYGNSFSDEGQGGDLDFERRKGKASVKKDGAYLSDFNTINSSADSVYTYMFSKINGVMNNELISTTSDVEIGKKGAGNKKKKKVCASCLVKSRTRRDIKGGNNIFLDSC